MQAPKTYTTLLQEVLSLGATEAMIAGGAVRDLLLHKPIKDIDVFINGDINLTIPSMFNIPEDIWETQEIGPYEDSGWNVIIPKITWGNIPQPIQIIKVEGDLMEHLELFGCKLSQIYVHSNHLPDIRATKAACKDFINGKLTFLENCSLSYKTKMIMKYPEYTPVYLGEPADVGEQSELTF